jgi:hypothetical protein
MPSESAVPIAHAFCRRYAYIASIDRLWDRNTHSYITVKAATLRHAAEMEKDKTVFHVLFKGPNAIDTVDGVTFWPGQPELVEEDGGRKLNRWSPVTLEPRPGRVRPFLRHLGRIVDSDPAAIAFVLNYMAHLVQHPDVKIQSALLFIGDPGTGKSILADVFMEMVGRQNSKTINASDFTSDFNGSVDGALLTVVDELVNDKSRATAARIKSVITNPTVRVNEKNLPTYECRNRNHLVLLSNDHDAATVDMEDRRFFIWRSTAPPPPGSYYWHLRRWLSGGGYARVLHLLQTRDISRFDPFTHPPRTASRAEIAGYSRSDHEVYLAEALEAGEAPFACDLIVIQHVFDYLNDARRMRVMPKTLSRFLRSAGAVELGQKRIGGAKPRVWAIRNAERWKTASEDEIAAAYGRPGDLAPERRESAPQPVRRTKSLSDL